MESKQSHRHRMVVILFTTVCVKRWWTLNGAILRVFSFIFCTGGEGEFSWENLIEDLLFIFCSGLHI